MPLMSCTKNGLKGWKYGKAGFCYVGNQAKEKAAKQGAAIEIHKTDSVESIQNQIAKKFSFSGKKRKFFPKPPRMVPPIAIENKYKDLLFRIIAIMQAQAENILFPHLESLVNEYKSITGKTDSRFDGWAENADRLISSLRVGISEIDKIDTKTMAQNIGQYTSEWNDRQWRGVMTKVLGVNVIQREPWLNDLITSFSKENVALIKSIKDKTVSDIEGMVQRGIKSGQRHETIRKEIESQFDVSRSRAKLIARDQVAKLNGQLTEARQTNLGIEKYTWRTSLDERVRPSHQAKEGKVFSWDNPPADTGHPGEDYQCRCVAEPVFEGMEDLL